MVSESVVRQKQLESAGSVALGTVTDGGGYDSCVRDTA